MDFDIIDLLKWRFNQLDDAVLKDTSTPRWRHFLKSDFVVCYVPT
jgi:hypothetical protein